MNPTSVESLVQRALDAGEGILRLAPTWVPRSFLQPGRRLKLHPDDYYALGAHRGGIDERWFASTTPAANEGAPPEEGLSFIVFEDERVTLRDAVAACGAELIGKALWEKHRRWPVYSKFFDNMNAIPHHMHQNDEQAERVGMDGKPEAYYFPPQLNTTLNNFPYTFFGLEPGVTPADARRCLQRWATGDNGILDLSRAYRLKPGTGWLVPPCLLHAPGSLVTYEPQWGSDVFGMYESLPGDGPVGWDLMTCCVPKDKHHDLDYLIDQLDWAENTDPHFRDNHYLEPIPAADTAADGYVDRWVVYGKVKGKELFTAKELTVEPGVKAAVRDNGAYGLIVVQGAGRIGALRVQCPALIRYGQMTEDELFVTHEAAQAGVVYENTSEHEPLVVLRYFGPDTNPEAPEVGDWKTLT